MSSQQGHYVYIYRDKGSREIRYVGYGREATRASSHKRGTHNADLESLIQTGKYALEIAGPYESKEVGLQVETAIITAVNPRANISKGQREFRFRPLGVPGRYAHRLEENPITAAELGNISDGSSLCVNITNKAFINDDRAGYDPANPPNDIDIFDRVVKYWAIGSHVEGWSRKPESAPKVLLGINGSPGSQVIIASIKIDRTRLNDSSYKTNHGFIVPAHSNGSNPKGLDACQLRGRHIDPQSNLAFNSISSQLFAIIDREGNIHGGRKVIPN